jgi:hypothetical protein
MNKERELLALILSYAGNKYLTVDEFEMMAQIEETFKEISELLAQPEQEPVEDRIARWHKLGYEQGRKSLKREPLSDEEIDIGFQTDTGNYIDETSFIAGVIFAEKAHGITGGGE